MFMSMKPSPWCRVAGGLGIGLVIGILFAGSGWPNVPLHAVSTDRTDGFAIATGYCDESVEAVYFLDFVTGDLSAAVVSKQNGRFNAFYKHNVVADLGINPAKPPRFLLTTGTVDLRRSGGKTNALSRSLVYVAELQSGKVATYAIPWSSSAWNAGQTLGGEFTLLDVGRFSPTGGREAVKMSHGSAMPAPISKARETTREGWRLPCRFSSTNSLTKRPMPVPLQPCWSNWA